MKLSELDRAVLTRLSDGALHNPFAWPLCADPDDLGETLWMLWASAWLAARGYVEMVDEAGAEVWLQITEAGRAALNEGIERD